MKEMIAVMDKDVPLAAVVSGILSGHRLSLETLAGVERNAETVARMMVSLLAHRHHVCPVGCQEEDWTYNPMTRHPNDSEMYRVCVERVAAIMRDEKNCIVGRDLKGPSRRVIQELMRLGLEVVTQ